MALTRAQLLAGDSTQGVVLANEVQGVKQGTGVSISADGTLSFDPSTASGILLTNNVLAYNTYVWPTQGPTGNGQILLADSGGNLSWTINYVATSGVNTAAKIPAGTTAQRPAPADLGSFRYNTQTNALEYYNGSSWVSVGSVGQSILTNNISAFNSYVWPNGDGGLGQFLQTDGNGNLTWADAKGYAVVTVSTQEPSPPDEGELWFDCGTGTLKVYQTCVSPAGWTAAGAGGLAVLPANTTSSPPFTGGAGTSGNPYTLGALSVSTGGSTLVATVTVTNLAPFQSVTVADINGTLNGGRFQFTNTIANSSGVLTFEILFNDVPASAPGASYTPLIKIGDATVFITGTVAVVDALVVTPGSIIGTPFVGQAVNYVTGAATGGLAPYAYTYQWARDGVDIAGATSVTYTPVNADLNKTLSVRITATDSIGGRGSATAQASSVTLAPVVAGNVTSSPAFIGGTGAQTTPYTLASTSVGAAGSVVVSQITVTNLAPNQQVIVSDVNSAANAGRFTVTNDTANGSGTLVFDIVFTDQPSSTSGTNYTATIQIGSQVFIEAPVLVVNALTVTPGSIGGFPQVNAPVNYTVGQASGGVTPYTYTFQWFADGATILGATSSSYTPGAGLVDQVLSVQITARDARNTTATATATAPGPVVFPEFPRSIWFQTPVDGLDTNPGLVQGLYKGFNNSITTTGCVEASINSGPYSVGTQPIAFDDFLAIRWVASATCGDAASGTTITGTITDSTYQNTYSLTINRLPSTVPLPSETDVELGATITATLLGTLAGTNSPSYVNYSSASTATNILAAVGAGPYQAVPTTGQDVVIHPGEILSIRYDVGTATSTEYTAIIQIGDGTGVAGTFSQGTALATTTSFSDFPNLASTLVNGPTYIPEVVQGTWADGTLALVTSGCLQISLDGTSFGTTVTVNDGNEVYLRWDPTGVSCGGAASGTVLNGTLSGGPYTRDYIFTVDKDPDGFNVHSSTIQPTTTEVQTPAITITGYNAPAPITYTPGSPNPLTDVKVSINGAPYVLIPTSGTSLTVDPLAASLSFRGTTGASLSTDYTATINIGGTSDTWSVTTNSAVPEIMTPSIISPSDSGVGGDGTANNPSVNYPAVFKLLGSPYEAMNGAPAQTGSTWEGYEGSYPLTSTNFISSLSVTPPEGTVVSSPRQIAGDRSSLNGNAAQIVYNGEFLTSATLFAIRTFGSVTYPIPTSNTTITNSGSLNTSIQSFIAVGGGYALWAWDKATVSVGYIGQASGSLLLDPGSPGASDTPPSPTIFTPAGTFGSTRFPELTYSKGVWYQKSFQPSGTSFITSYRAWRAGFVGWQNLLSVVTGIPSTTVWFRICASPAATLFQDTGQGPTVYQSLDGINFSVNTTLSAVNQALDPKGLASYSNVIIALFEPNGGGNGRNVYVSTDGGVTYAENVQIRLQAGTVFGCASAAEGIYLYADSGIYLTVDGVNYAQVLSGWPDPLSNCQDFYLTESGSLSYTSAGNQNYKSLPNAVGRSVLNLSGAVDDGFRVDDLIQSSPGTASAIIREVDGTGITIYGDATAQGWAGGNTQKVVRDPSTYSVLAGSPYSGLPSNLVATDIPQADLTPSSRVYFRVKYTTGGLDSEFSPWVEYQLADEFYPPQGLPLAGGYFGGQMFDGGQIYNLVVAPKVGDVNGPNYFSGNLTGQFGGRTPAVAVWKTTDTVDVVLSDNRAYGGITSDALADAFHPLFQWLTTPTGPNAGVFDITGASNGTGIGGFNDWYIPALNEMIQIYRTLKPSITTNLVGATISANPDAAPEPTPAFTATDPARTSDSLFQVNGNEAWPVSIGDANEVFFTASQSTAVGVWCLGFDRGTITPRAKTGASIPEWGRAIRRTPA